MGKKLLTVTLCVFVASTMVGSVVYAGDPTLIGWWKLNEGTGTTVLDLSGNGHDGTILNPNGGLGTGGSVWVDDPERGMVVGFNGTDGSGACIRTGLTVPALTLTNQFTYIFWTKQHTSQATNNDTILGNRYGGVSSPLQFIKFTPTRFECYNDDGAYANGVNYGSIPNGVWVHHALVKDGASQTYYRDGVVMGTNTMTKAVAANPFYMGADAFSGVTEAWQGYMSDVRLYTRALTEKEVKDVMAGKGPNAELAANPVPEDGATDIPRDAVLSWGPGELAATHDVYLGTTLADVDGADRANPMGVLASQSQAAAEYDPEGLVYGQTYYWRVDEVNAAPDNSIFKGEVWSFTAEPFSYPIANITATASSSQVGMKPQNTVNGSGLNDKDEHSTELTDMWTSTGAQPNWIQYEFDKVYKLDEMWVWNSNQLIETFLGFGAKDVTIEYSADGQTWTALEGVPQFAKATATPTYKANTIVDFGGAVAKFVKLTITKNWGGVAPQSGLSEVRFFQIPVQARAPQPANEATGVSIDAALDWRPGREAGSHDVFLGADADGVAAGTVPAVNVADHGFDPDVLDFATTYFWKVNEVNATGSYDGEVWSFTTEEYAVVDDFEGYNDDDNRIYDAWIDGLTDAAKGGSQVGYDVSPFAEKGIVHGGKQAMPLIYDNAAAPFLSEAERTFDTPRNWAVSGADTLSLYFQGAADNSPEGLYLTVKDSAGKSKTVIHASAAATTTAEWRQWEIPLSEFTAAGVKVNAVKSMTIGVGNKAAPIKGGAGKLIIDDIGFGRPLP